MKTNKLLIAYLLVQGVDLAQSNKFVDIPILLEEAENQQIALESAYTVTNVKLIPLNKEKTSFNLEGLPKNNVYTSSTSFSMLDFSKEYNLLIKSLVCKEILAYAAVES